MDLSGTSDSVLSVTIFTGESFFSSLQKIVGVQPEGNDGVLFSRPVKL